MAGNSDLVDFFRLDASFDPIYAVTRENVRAADGTRRTVVKEWRRTKRLGNGAFGTVWLEKEMKKGDLRAVKEVSKYGSTTARMDYKQELVALGHLSKVSSTRPYSLLVIANIPLTSTRIFLLSFTDGLSARARFTFLWSISNSVILRSSSPHQPLH
jgi:hypothetical protein